MRSTASRPGRSTQRRSPRRASPSPPRSRTRTVRWTSAGRQPRSPPRSARSPPTSGRPASSTGSASRSGARARGRSRRRPASRWTATAWWPAAARARSSSWSSSRRAAPAWRRPPSCAAGAARSSSARPLARAVGGDGVSPDRATALRVLRRADGGAYADRAFRGEAARAGLEPRERARAMRLAYGVIQRCRTLDWLIDGATHRPEGLEPALRDVLRLGAFEISFSDGTPPHAAVDQAVRAARALGGGPRRAAARAGVVNAVLRRLSAEAGPRLARLEAGGPGAAALLHSVPDWIAERLAASLGEEEAAAVLAAANRPAESALRWNPLRGPRATLERELPAGWARDPLLPEAYVLGAPFALEESEAWRRGRAMGQSRASMLPARAVAPRPGERILDLCAAPGAKATHLAALASGGARVTAVELRPARAEAMRALARRLGARLEVVEGDARTVSLDGPFDAALVDPPCTEIGRASCRER